MGKKWASGILEEIYKTKIYEKTTILEDGYGLKYEHRPLYHSGERSPQSPKPPVDARLKGKEDYRFSAVPSQLLG